MMRFNCSVHRTTSLSASLIVAIASLFLGPDTPREGIAADFYWDANATAAGNNASTGSGLGGSGVWNLSTFNWWDGSANVAWPNGTDTAVFAGLGGTVTISTDVTAGNITFLSNRYTLTEGKLTLAGLMPSVTVTANVTSTIGSIVDGVNGLLKAGNGTLVLAGTNSYSGGTTISGGRLTVMSDAALGATSSGVYFSQSGILSIGATGITLNSTRGISVATGATAVLELSGSMSGVVSVAGALAYGGVVSGAGNIVIDGGPLRGSTPVTLTMNGAAQTLSGSLTVNNNMTIVNVGSTMSWQNITGLNLRGGTVAVVNNSASAALNRFNNDAPIVINGGTITFSNTAGANVNYAETIGTVTIGSGALNIVLGLNQTAANNTQVLTLTGFQRTGPSATAHFTATTTAPNDTRNIILVNGAAQTVAGRIIGPWATVGTTPLLQNDYAIFDSAGRIIPLNAAPTADDSTWSTSWTSSSNVNLSGTAALTANRVVNSLRYSGASGVLDLSDKNLSTYGILSGGGASLNIIGSGVLTTPVGGSNSLYLISSNVTAGAGVGISASIDDNGAPVTVVIGGSGGVTLSGVNNYSGNTVINSGILTAFSAAALGAAGGSIIFNGSAQLNIGLTGSTAITHTLNQSIVLNNGVMPRIKLNYLGNASNVTVEVNGAVSGDGGIIFDGTNNDILNLNSTNNTFTGAVVLNTASTAIPNVGLGVASLADTPGSGPIRFMPGSTGAPFFRLNNAATQSLVINYRQFELAGVATGASGGGIISNVNVDPNKVVIVNTDLLITGTGNKVLYLQGTNTGNNTFNGKIADGVVNGLAAPVRLVKDNAGTWVLGNSNSFSGGTTIIAGVLRSSVTDAFGANPLITIGASGILSLRGDTSRTFATTSGTPYSVAFSASGVTIDVGAETVAAPGTALNVGVVSWSNAASANVVNFTGSDVDITFPRLIGGIGTTTGGMSTTISNNITAGKLYIPVFQNVYSVTNTALTSLFFAGTGTTILSQITLSTGVSGLDAMPLSQVVHSGVGVVIIESSLDTLSTGEFAVTGGGRLDLISAGSSTISVRNGTLRLGSLADSANDIAIGSATSSGTLILNSPTSASYTNRRLALNGSSGNSTIQNDGAGVVSLSGPLVQSGASNTRYLILSGTNTGANNLGSILGPGTGTTGLLKTGNGQWILSGANTYNGITSVTSGTLRLEAGGTLGNATGTVNVSGGVLDLNGVDVTKAAALNLSGGRLLLNGATMTVSALNLVAAASTTSMIGPGTLISTGVIALTNDTAFSLTIDAALAGTTFTKTGSGTVSINGAASYVGATTIFGGITNFNGGLTGNSAALTLTSATLNFSNTAAFGNASIASSTLNFFGNTTASLGTVTLTGSTWNVGSPGTLTTGAIVVSLGSLVQLTGASAVGALTVTGNSAMTATGISAAGAINVGNFSSLSYNGTTSGAINVLGNSSLTSVGTLTAATLTVGINSSLYVNGTATTGIVSITSNSTLTALGTLTLASLTVGLNSTAYLDATAATGAVNVLGNSTLSASGTLTAASITVNASSLYWNGTLTTGVVSVTNNSRLTATGILTTGAITVGVGSTLNLNGTATTGAITVTVGSTLNIGGNGSASLKAGALTLGSSSNAGVTVVNLTGNSTASIGAFAANQSSDGMVIFNQSSGTLTAGAGIRMTGGNGFGVFNLAGGTVFSNAGGSNYNSLNGGVVGGSSAGVMNISGGTLNTDGSAFLFIGYGYNQSNVTGLLNITGGEVTHNLAVNPTYLFYSGTAGSQYGVLNLAGGNFTSTDGTINFGTTGNANGTGLVNLVKGTATFRNFAIAGSGVGNSSFVNFAGGKIVSSASTVMITGGIATNTLVATVFGPVNNGTAATNFAGGITFDTAAFTTTIGTPLRGASGYGVTQSSLGDLTLLAGNDGYLATPAIVFSSTGVLPGGTPASGYSVVDPATGKLTKIVITSPGTYADGTVPTVTLTGGGGTIGSFTLGSLSANANTGGLIKAGTGTLSLTAVNTYGGTTSIQQGILKLAANGSIDNSAVISISGGAMLDVSAKANFTIAAGQTLAALDGGVAVVAGAAATRISAAGRTIDLLDGTDLGTLAFTGTGLILNNSTLRFDLGAAGSDLITVAGTVALGGLNTIHLAALGGATSLLTGTRAYTLVTTGGGWDSSLFTLDVSQMTLGNTLYSFALEGNLTTQFLNVTSTFGGGPPPGPNNLLWTGAVTGTWNTTSANWTGSNTVYADGDRVLFNDTSAVNTLTIVGSVTPGSITVDTSSTYAIYGGPITGTADLLKQGTGTLVLAASHLFTGPTTVAGGTLQLGGDYASNIALQNAALQFSTTGNQTISGLISGSGFLQKLGSGTTTLLAQNTFSGITSVDAGTLVVNHALSGTVFVNAGGAFSGSGSSLSSVIVQGGSGNITGTQQGALDISSGSVTIQSGGATTGTVTIDAGTLTALSGATIGNTLGIQVNGGTFDVQSGAQIIGNGQINVSGTLRADGDVDGLVVIQNGGLVNGNGSVGSLIIESGGTLSVGHSVGTLTLDGGPLGASAAALTLNAGANLIFEFNNALGTPGAAGGNGGWDYIELGAGTLTVNATNYSVTDRINLHIDSLTLLGNVHGTADNFDPRPGIVGDVQTYYWKFIGVDLANVQLNPGDITTSNSLNGRFNIIDDAVGAGVFYDDGIPNGNPFSRPVSHLGQGTFKVVAGDFGQGEGVYIHYSAVPEPGSMLLTGLGALAAGWYRKRRRQTADKSDDAT